MQFAGGERCSAVAPELLLLYVLDRPLGLFERGDDGIHLLLVGQRRSVHCCYDRFFAIDAGEARSKLCLFACRGELGIERPILDGNERLDLALALHDEAQSYGLYPACGETAPYLVP